MEEMYEAWPMTQERAMPPGMPTSEEVHSRPSPLLGSSTRPLTRCLWPADARANGLLRGEPWLEVDRLAVQSLMLIFAVQGTIRSIKVRGHLAAQIDPLGLNNMDREEQAEDDHQVCPWMKRTWTLSSSCQRQLLLEARRSPP